MKKSSLFLDSFWLKIIAIITMTIDHIGIIIFVELNDPIFQDLYHVFRGIGRVSLPLFAFMLVEGVFHTRNVWKYLGRIGLSATVVAIGLMVGNAMTSGFIVNMPYLGNIFMDFLLSGAIIACLRLKDFKKLFALIPLGIYILLLNLDYEVFYMIALQYGWYSLGIILVFFGADYLVRYLGKFLAQQYQMDYEGFKLTSSFQFFKNVVGVLLFVCYSVAVYLLLKEYPNLSRMNNASQTYAALAGIFIVFYNGKRGYNKKWFQYGCYAYYGVHIVLLFGISLLL